MPDRLLEELKLAGFEPARMRTPEFESYLRHRPDGYVDLVRLPNPGVVREIEVCTWMSEDELLKFLK